MVQMGCDVEPIAKVTDWQRKYQDERDNRDTERINAKHTPQQKCVPKRSTWGPGFLTLQGAHQYKTGMNKEKEHAEEPELHNAQTPDVGIAEKSQEMKTEDIH